MSGRKFRLADDVISGLAIFSLKSHSRLQFDRHANEADTVRFNLRSLFDVRQAPPDSGLRLDDVDPRSLRPVFKRGDPGGRRSCAARRDRLAAERGPNVNSGGRS